MGDPQLATSPIYSTLGADPDLGELVEMFVEEMPERVAQLSDAFQAGHLDELARCAHQLKGASGSYGFDQMTSVAGQLESAVKEGDSSEEIQSALQQLANLCQRARAGSPD